MCSATGNWRCRALLCFYSSNTAVLSGAHSDQIADFFRKCFFSKTERNVSRYYLQCAKNVLEQRYLKHGCRVGILHIGETSFESNVSTNQFYQDK